MPDAPIPIQPVQNPILCSPYDEPDQHWLYDTQTGRPSKVPARRDFAPAYHTPIGGHGRLSVLRPPTATIIHAE